MWDLIKEDKIPYFTGHMRGIKEDVYWDYYFSGKVVERRVPGSLPNPMFSYPILFI